MKLSSVLVKDTLSDRDSHKTCVMYVKGAAEQMMRLCKYRMTAEGDIEELSRSAWTDGTSKIC